MAIALRGAGTFTESGSVSSTSVPYPATVVAGDLVVLLGSVKNAALVPNQTGFTTQASFSNTGSTILPDIWVGTLVAAGTEGGTNFSAAHATGVNASAWQILVLSGADTSNPMDVAAVPMDITSASTTTSTTGVTIVSPGAALIYCAAQNSTTGTSTPPTQLGGFTETGDRSTGTATFTVAYKLGQVAGATGTIGNLWSGSARSVGVLLTIRPLVAVSVSPPAAQATTSAPVPAVSQALGLAMVAAAVTAAAIVPVVTLAQSPAAPAAQATTAGVAPALTLGMNLGLPAGAATGAGVAPAISLGLGVAPPAGQASAAGVAPVVSLAISLGIPAGQATAAGVVPAIGTGTAVTVAIPAGAATTTAPAPTVTLAAGAAPPAAQAAAASTPPAIATANTLAIPSSTATTSAPTPGIGLAFGALIPAAQASTLAPPPTVRIVPLRDITVLAGPTTSRYASGPAASEQRYAAGPTAGPGYQAGPTAT